MTNFDVVARWYYLLEFCTFGSLLTQTRGAFLNQVRHAEHALIVGDGDGRFLAQLLNHNERVVVLSIDSSQRMLALQQQRLKQSAQQRRASLLCADANHFEPSEQYDLFVTHFLLDCLAQNDVRVLAQRFAQAARPQAIWLVSEFHIPEGKRGAVARLLIRIMYSFFRVTTGLNVCVLPAYEAVLPVFGFIKTKEQVRCFGLLKAQLWQLAGTCS